MCDRHNSDDQLDIINKLQMLSWRTYQPGVEVAATDGGGVRGDQAGYIRSVQYEHMLVPNRGRLCWRCMELGSGPAGDWTRCMYVGP